jgi:hypothetical protein
VSEREPKHEPLFDWYGGPWDGRLDEALTDLVRDGQLPVIVEPPSSDDTGASACAYVRHRVVHHLDGSLCGARYDWMTGSRLAEVREGARILEARQSYVRRVSD